MHKNALDIQNALGNSSDIVIRNIGEDSAIQASVFYIDGLVNTERLEEHVISPLVHNVNAALKTAKMLLSHSTKESIKAIIQGNAVVVNNVSGNMTIVDVSMWKERPIGEALTERNSVGLLLGFTEKAATNISILRGILKTPNFMVENIEKGTLTPTTISIAYMRNIVDKGVLKEVKKRINDVHVKYVLQAAIVEVALKKNKMTIFPLTSYTEAPDIAASAILEGKVVVFVDNTPHAIICPSLFVSFFQSPEEYYSSYGSFSNRFIKVLSFFIATHASATYILLYKSNVFSEKINKLFYPKDALVSPLISAVILTMLLKILTDGMFKVNKNLTTFFAFISTILITESLLKLKIISPFCLFVVSLAYVITFLFQSRGGISSTILGLNNIHLLAAVLFGLPGVILLTSVMIIHVVMLKSINVPYFSPLIPFKPKELRDVFFRSNLKEIINSKHSYLKKGNRRGS
ncbi:spore germination protein KA [Paenibacillus taihuensis]|uniref:Spore germination protein KA n=1 Tax=Paenibacillus taihuensis TaxID=1156355 RepID=A0A3D9RIE3_9BACL|nr:spore germination protein [Paenibacillus taihuensis]REE78567.1 spore germination protein KA [Paenibacillus taihuensis]